MLVILSGVSGAGKDTIKKELLKRMDDVITLPSFTSREKRPTEEEGVQYHFITKEEFEEKIKNGDFYEYDVHHGNYYGTSRKLMKEKISQGKIIVKDIEAFSYCEHHMALMYDMKITVAYLPKGRVIGLSKIARIADMVARRLQLQERIGTDIASIMTKVTGSEDVAVVIEGCHSCVTSRGIKKNSSKTVTTTFLGKFKDDVLLQNQLLIHLR